MNQVMDQAIELSKLFEKIGHKTVQLEMAMEYIQQLVTKIKDLEEATKNVNRLNVRVKELEEQIKIKMQEQLDVTQDNKV